MSNVNNLNGVPNFGHGEEEIPNQAQDSSLDEIETALDTTEVPQKLHKSKVRSAARKAFGGKY